MQACETRLQDGSTPLYHACLLGHVDIVHHLVRAGANVRAPTLGLSRPLLIAAANGHVPCVHAMLKAGAPVNDEDKYGACALLAAAAHGQHGVVKDLLEANADPQMRDKEGRSALCLAAKAALKQAISLRSAQAGSAAHFRCVVVVVFITCTKDDVFGRHLGIPRFRI